MRVENRRDQGSRTVWKITFQRYALYVVGIFVLAFGSAAMIQANLGVSSWDVLHIGMTNWTPLSIGTWVQIVGLLMLGDRPGWTGLGPNLEVLSILFWSAFS
ncbi:hypothetical protein [Paenibacillus larvae]|uniref:hypothetical protein n=1 Tax=Paenibacillus larvae TaxID=1464 RepID=UPI00288CEAD8|nr:hypothetical protein [Paenibacillus larvae]MDT2194317.1 hypothetical protein [Paenibacillus larvae]MDT2236842.1 hypothetical protein [Paenibacillus larvae]